MLGRLVQQIFWQMGALCSTPVFWLAVAVVYLQARGRARRKAELFQLRREPVAGAVCLTVLAGVLGGALASVLLLLLGVSAARIGLGYLWALALLLLLLRQRFLCFAYSGGILAAAAVLGVCPAVDAAQLLATVAVLHATEAFLVLTTGHLNALPLYLRGAGREPTGGFLLQMVWPLPLVMLGGIAGTPPQAGVLSMPAWWPVLGGSEGYALYWLLPAVAALGYSDLAAGCDLRRQTRRAAAYLFGYGALLLALVLAAREHGMWLLLPAFFAPLGHEAVIALGRRSASSGTDEAAGPGALVLAVQAASPAARAGLRSRDRIVALGGVAVADRRAYLRLQYRLPHTVSCTYLRRGRRRHCRLRLGRWSQPGIITAPDGQCDLYWEPGQDRGLLGLLCDRFAPGRMQTP